MSATTTVTLLTTTTFGTEQGNYDGSSTTFESADVKGDGYYGFADGVHTVQTRVTGLIGTVKIQGTLAGTPVSTDWVDIESIVTSDGSSAITESYLNNFTGNYTWIRIAVSGFTAGTINNIYLAH
jgi:hypothetical protein